jgi:mRNA-degrading endonuclease RelE of RelBE toxin-antitoxin system
MTGTKNMYRLRFGKYRIALTWNRDKQELIAERVALRKDIYKKK